MGLISNLNHKKIVTIFTMTCVVDTHKQCTLFVSALSLLDLSENVHDAMVTYYIKVHPGGADQ